MPLWFWITYPAILIAIPIATNVAFVIYIKRRRTDV